MRKMKDSGIEWISAIPNTWEVHPIYFYFSERKNKNILGNEQNLLSLSYGNVIRKNINTVGGLLPESFNTYNIIETDDIIIRPTDLQNDKRSLRTGLCKEHGIITSAYIALKPIAKNNISYVHYLLHTYDIMKVFYNMGNGVRQGLNYSEFSKLMLFMPPIEEQQSIANYLDRKCNEIDSLICDIQKQIELLEEYKRSVITEAVTKGLDSDVEMRDSGVQWMGKIPKHWVVDNPKWHFVQRKDRATKGLTQLTASQKYGVVSQEEYMEITGAKVVTVEKDFDILKLVCPGDFIIHMRSFQGGLEYSEKYGSISSAYVMLIPQKTILEPRFYKWFFKSPVYIDALSSTSNLIRDGQAMRYANFIQLPIPLMPLEEQCQIADYLDKKCAEIDSIISEKKQQIETIEEYKKSLIFEFVTGKKEVPHINVIIDHKTLLAYIMHITKGKLKGKIQLQKIMYLCEIYLGIDLNTVYHRAKHGPYDYNLDSYLNEINNLKWYNIPVNGNPMIPSYGEKYSEFEEKYISTLSKYELDIKKITSFIIPMKTSESERVATLYASWNDMIIDGNKNPTFEEIHNDVINNWTTNKGNFKKETWKDTYDKMLESGIVPKGNGLHTAH